MRVSLDISAVRRTEWHQFAIRFGLGGLVTACTGLLAKQFGPEWAGLFLAFPAIFLASVTLIAKHERDKKARQGIDGQRRAKRVASLDAAGAVLGSVGLACFALCLWRGLPVLPAPIVLTVASVVWLSVSILLWYFRKTT